MMLATLKNILRYPSMSILARDVHVVEVGKTLISYYYYALPYLAIVVFPSLAPTRPNFDPIWPLWWMDALSLSYGEGANIIRFLFLATTLLGVFLHRHRLGRILVFIGLWQMHALESSFGQPNHQWYMFVYSSLIFVFLPNVWRAPESFDKNRTFLLIIWWAQALVMLLYSMAGIQKIFGALRQFFVGEIHGFSMHGFAYQIADWLPKLQDEAVLGPFLIENPFWGWPFYVGLHFLQAFALWVMVRPSLQRVWAFFLVLSHVGIMFTMGISFNPLPLLLILLFFNSPFIKPNTSLKEMLFDLPVLGQILEWASVRRLKAKSY